MSTTITPDPEFNPVGRATLETAAPFLSLWIGPDTFVQIPATPAGREWMHKLADEARLLTLSADREARA